MTAGQRPEAEPPDGTGGSRERDRPTSPGTDAGAANPPGHVCEVCGAPMYERHCKIACPNCGYLRDCSDP